MSLLFKNLLKDLIVENSRFQVLYDKFVKPKDKGQKGILPFETLFALIAADPTSSFPDGIDMDNVTPKDMDRVKIGKYTQWLLKNFIAPKLEPNHPLNIVDPKSGQYKSALKEYRDLFMEDLYKVTGDLRKFERFKNRLPQEFRDVNKLTIDTLYDQVKDFSLEKTKATKMRKKWLLRLTNTLVLMLFIVVKIGRLLKFLIQDKSVKTRLVSMVVHTKNQEKVRQDGVHLHQDLLGLIVTLKTDRYML